MLPCALIRPILERWKSRLEDLSHPVTLLDVLNTNRATLEDWQTFLNAQPHDVTVLHGVQSELYPDEPAPSLAQLRES